MLSSDELRAVTAADVVNLATEAGVPPGARPAIVLLSIREDRAADGRLLTPAGWAPLALQCPGWPAGELDVVEAIVAGRPSDHSRPYLDIGDGGITVYAASLALPNGNAAADIAWRDGRPRSVVRFRTGEWTTGDGDAALAALRWLETLPRPSGGPRATSPDDAFEEAVKLGLEWLGDHPDKHPKDFGIPQFSAKRCTGIPATKAWMREKQFGIKRVRQEMARRVQWPS